MADYIEFQIVLEKITSFSISSIKCDSWSLCFHAKRRHGVIFIDCK